MPGGLLLVASYLLAPDRLAAASSPGPRSRRRGRERDVIARGLGSTRRYWTDPAHPSSLDAQARRPPPGSRR